MTKIILAAPEDFPRVRAFYHSLIDEMQSLPTFPGWEKGVYPTDSDLSGHIVRSETHLLTVDGEIAAAMSLNRDGDGYDRIAWPSGALDCEFAVVHLLSVHPRFGRRGFGKRMIQLALDLAREQGLKAVRLDIADNNSPARRLYVDAGFHYVSSATTLFDDGTSMGFEFYELTL